MFRTSQRRSIFIVCVFALSSQASLTDPNGALVLARDCSYLNAFAFRSTSVRLISFGFDVFKIFFYFCERKKNRFPYL